MDEHDWLAEQFEEHRAHLRAVAYRMLGSLSEADDAVQEAWLRLSRVRHERRREPRRLADDGRRAGVPQHAALAPDAARGAAGRPRARSDRQPRRRHSIPSTRRCWPTRSGSRCSWCSRRWRPPSGSPSCCTTCSRVPFDEIAPIVGRSPAAARQLASRARRRVQGAAPVPDADLAAPARGRRRLLRRRARRRLRGARRGARPGRRAARRRRRARPGATAVVRGARRWPRGRSPSRGSRRSSARRSSTAPRASSWPRTGEPFSVMGFTVAGGKIVEIDALADPERLRELDLAVLDD